MILDKDLVHEHVESVSRKLIGVLRPRFKLYRSNRGESNQNSVPFQIDFSVFV